LAGLLLGIRFLVFAFMGQSGGHIQSLILCNMLIIMGFLTYMIGIMADTIASNRKILEDVQLRVRKLEYRRDAEQPEKANHAS